MNKWLILIDLEETKNLLEDYLEGDAGAYQVSTYRQFFSEHPEKARYFSCFNISGKHSVTYNKENILLSFGIDFL